MASAAVRDPYELAVRTIAGVAIWALLAAAWLANDIQSRAENNGTTNSACVTLIGAPVWEYPCQ